MPKTIEDVKTFWEENPLFSGESAHEAGTKEFFEQHRKVYYEDVFAGKFKDEKFMPKNLENSKVLDLGCGVGFWTIEIQQKRKCSEFYSGDLTQQAVDTTQKRLKIYGLQSLLSIQNAEHMTYESGFFDHVNCQGVIHHTPDTDATVKEIARVLKTGGTASISVYYKNFFLRNWNKFSFLGKLLSKLGGGMKGRGRESIFDAQDSDEITRLYDGSGNPIGKSYTNGQIVNMVSNYFEVERTFLYFFPARALPIKIPKFAHRWLANNFGFMIHLSLRKK